jgi:hypothetical protein
MVNNHMNQVLLVQVLLDILLDIELLRDQIHQHRQGILLDCKIHRRLRLHHLQCWQWH